MNNLGQRAAGYASVAKQGRDVVAARARQGNWQKCLAEVDPDGVLTMAERVTRALDLQQSKMLLLSKRSAEVRAARKHREELAEERAQRQHAQMLARQDAAIRAIVSPPVGCSYCAGPLAPGVTHQTCAAHQEQARRELTR